MILDFKPRNQDGNGVSMSALSRFLLMMLATRILSGVASSELVAHWPLDTDTNDQIGAHHGTPSGVIFGASGAAAHTGTAAEFDGSATITVPHHPDLNPASFTLSMWVNADNTSGFASAVTSRDDISGGVSTHGYIVYNDSGGNWNFWTGDGNPGWNTVNGGSVEVGSWTHLAITYSDSTKTKKIYVNGELANSTTGDPIYSPNGPQTENLHIGSGGDAGTEFHFDGLIDDIALWDEELSESAIEDVMNNGVPGGAPVVSSFTASPPLIDSGQSTTLSWNTINATSVEISPDVGPVASPSGTIEISPTETTTYTITATGETSPPASRQITIGVDVESLAPVITEFVADNETGLTDPDGDFSDWIELYNPNPFAIDIGGWHLTDDPLDLQKYTIPPQQIEAGQFVILFATNKDDALNFQLSKSGDYLALVDPDGNILQEFAPTYPPQFDDVSYGLSSSGETTYLVPTPGTTNGAPRTELGPEIQVITENPAPPSATEDLIISASITPRIGAVAGATLIYRIGFGPEQSVPMTGEGTNYSATIPASAYEPGEMIRWYLTATTASGESSREPPFPDPLESARYHGTVATDLGTPIELPIMHWFVENPGAADTRGGTRGSLYFEGQFYDNIYCRIRGQSTANWPKHKYKFDFYRGGHFRWKSTAPRVEEINVNSHYRDSYVRENAIFSFLNDAGSLAPETRYLWIKRNGGDFGLFTFVEQVDEDFLTRRGFDASGPMYKAINVPATLSPTVNSSLYRKVLRKTEPYTDLAELTSGINISNPDRFDFVADEVNLPNYLNVMAAMCVPFNHDQLTKNYYMYRDLDRNEWFRVAWDGDQGLPTGQKNTHENWTSPLYGDAQHTQELVGGNPNPTWQNHLHAAILDNPVTREMYLRRVRTLMDQYLDIPPPGPSETLLPEGGNARFLVPVDNSLQSDWFAPDFDDSSWSIGMAGFGYENNPGDYLGFIDTRVKPTETLPGATSVYQRYQFDVSNADRFQNLILQIRYDDGFVAYLNGAEVARANITGPVSFNSTATSHSDDDAILFENFPISSNSLIDGTNVLSIQIINQSPGSSDLLCEPRLIDQPGASGGYFESLLAGFRDTIEPDVNNDQVLWSGEGINNFSSGYNAVLNTSLPNRRNDLFNTYGPSGAGLIPESQPSDAAVEFGSIEVNPNSGHQDEEFIELTNPNDFAIDLSGWTISGGVDLTLPPGSVIPSNGSLFLSPNVHDFRLRAASPTRGEGRFVIGNYRGHLSNFSETLSLADSSGVTIAEINTPDQPSNLQQFLVISEIMYHPIDGSGPEFLELLNISDDTTLDLSGVAFSDGIDFTFPAGLRLLPEQRLVIDSTMFLNGTALSNGGETIKLEDPSGSTIQEFRYDDTFPWPASPDGAGPSLVLINPSSNPDPDIAGNWRASAQNGGNPNDTDALVFTGEANGDLNGNGQPDLVDYVLAPGTSPSLKDGVFSFRRTIGTDDASITVESSTDLTHWTNAEELLEYQESTPRGDGTELLKFVLPQIASPQKWFLRLNVRLRDP